MSDANSPSSPFSPQAPMSLNNSTGGLHSITVTGTNGTASEPTSNVSSRSQSSVGASGGRQRRSAVRYKNLDEANQSPILSKPNKTVESEVSFCGGSLCSDSSVLTSFGIVSAMQGWRKTMEDAHYLHLANKRTANDTNEAGPAGDEAQCSTLAVLDGHRGANAATIAAKALPQAIAEEECLAHLGTDEQSLKEAASNICWKLDATLRMRPGGPVADGTTFNACIVQQHGRLVLINVGDSRSYVADVTGGERTMDGIVRPVLPVNDDHHSTSDADSTVSPCNASSSEFPASKAVTSTLTGVSIQATSKDQRASDDDETTRIQAAGGFVINGRVNGKLLVSRALGDFDMKTTKSELSGGISSSSGSPSASQSTSPQRESQLSATTGSCASHHDETDPLSDTASSLPPQHPIRPQHVVTCEPEVRIVDAPLSTDDNIATMYRIVLVGCDGVWELLTAAKIVDKLTPIVDQYLHNAGLEGVNARENEELLGASMKQGVTELLDHGCSPVCDQTGQAGGMDNMTLGAMVLFQ